ncbi:MAG TPA: GNAT family protein [Solirubrobacteraceae bacterium]|jgi:RimJ/RimL family protein N-acetyltransferase|nr:GNAT family protein [Solirubrobacteraceae bacterium]
MDRIGRVAQLLGLIGPFVVTHATRRSGLLRGDHVELTAVRDADRERLFEWINDREQVLYNAGYAPVHESDHVAWFESIRTRSGVVLFAIRTLTGEELIGSCQLRDIDHRHSTAELQIRIGAPEHRGKGYGTDAVRLLLTHAFRDLGLARVQLHVFATNPRAIRAYEKAGLRQEGVLRSAAYIDGRRCDVVVMGILRGEADVD